MYLSSAEGGFACSFFLFLGGGNGHWTAARQQHNGDSDLLHCAESPTVTRFFPATTAGKSLPLERLRIKIVDPLNPSDCALAFTTR